MINQHNFDWDITNRDVVIFIPNYKRKHLIIPTLDRFKTDVPRDKWIIVIANDYHHEEFSEEEQDQYNFRYFTLEREKGERNGCMIRNYFIKKCQSRIMASKDPEIIIDSDDYIERLMVLNNELHRAKRAIELREQDVQLIVNHPELDVAQFPIKREYQLHSPHVCEGFHFCFATSTQNLKDIGGYDEDFKDGYGYEDKDILERLIKKSSEVIMDPGVVVRHLWHPRRARFLKTVLDNGEIYKKKIEQGCLVANQDREWGEG